jgi:DNA-binding transcriptional ArsR family regulator
MVTANKRRQNVVFRAIAHPTRREILRVLRGGQQTVGQIASNFATSRPAISRHMRLLRSAGLVLTREKGSARLCELNAKPLSAVDDWLKDYDAFWRDSLRSLKRNVEEHQ